MKILSDLDIKKLNIKDSDILEWVKQAFLAKKDSYLPHKISITFDNGKKFYNTMPTVMPTINSAGVKIVSRYPNRKPSIQGHILLYELESGSPLAMMDATWITAKRTGAVAYLTLKTLAKKNFNSVAVIGLGQTGQAFLDMFTLESENKNKLIKLKRYKNHTDKIVEYLNKKGFYNIKECKTNEELIQDSDVIVSAITFASDLIGKDEWFKEGVLVIPIHTRGFQNCDLFFDKVVVDDIEHVKNFKYFTKFKKKLIELDRILRNDSLGRTSEKERIISYNIGIALHDIYIARMIFNQLEKK
jgi:ornithine cyclodeaminase/alanine dehydrogenase